MEESNPFNSDREDKDRSSSSSSSSSSEDEAAHAPAAATTKDKRDSLQVGGQETAPEQCRHSPLTLTVSGPDEPEGSARVILTVDAKAAAATGGGALKTPDPASGPRKSVGGGDVETGHLTPKPAAFGIRDEDKVSPTAPVITTALEEVKIVPNNNGGGGYGSCDAGAGGGGAHLPVAPTLSKGIPSPRRDLTKDNEANEKKAFMVALLEAPEVEKRKLSTSAQMLRKPDRKLSGLEVVGLKDKIRRDHLNTCRQLLMEAFPSGINVNPRDFKRAMSSPAILDELFGLFDHCEADHLKQTDWIDLLKSQVPSGCTMSNALRRKIRQSILRWEGEIGLRSEKNCGLDFVELIESVAYILVGEHDVNLAVFRRIFSSRGVLEKFFRLVDADKDDLISVAELMDMITTITMPRKDNVLTAENLALLEKMFREHMSKDSEIHLDQFKAILNSKNPFFAERVFSIFDRDGSGAISLTEFLESMGRFATQDHDEKISFLFQIYDVDGDGLIQRRELQAVLRACMDENGMNFSDEQLEDLTCALYEDADAGNEITYDALKAQLMKHDGLLENLSISIERWLVPPKVPEGKGNTKMQRPYQLTMPYMKNNYVYLIFLGLMVATNLILIAKRIYDFRTANGFLVVARICGQLLNFNSTFILVLMLRHTLTFLRNHGFAAILPLDQHIYLHKMTGWLILFFAMVHTVAHLANIQYLFIAKVNSPRNLTYAEWLFTTRPAANVAPLKINYGLVTAWANPTGCALVVILIVMVLCSLPCVRRSGNFEIFYWTHLLYIPYWVILVLHCKNFWKWLVGPGVIFVIERLVRIIQMRTKTGRTYISSGIMLPSKVTHLVIKRPANFYFSSGDYVFVNIPKIAKYEWHPFTISSAPELEDSLWLHIRGVGQWTNKLYEYFTAEQAKLENTQLSTVVPMEGFLKGLPVPARNNKQVRPSKERPLSGFQNFKRKISQSFRPGRDSFVVNQDVGMALNGSTRNGGSVNEGYTSHEGNMAVTLTTGRNGDVALMTKTPGHGSTSDVDVFLPDDPAGALETATHRRKTRFLSAAKKPANARFAPSPATTTQGPGVGGIVPPSQRKVEKTKSLPDLEVNMRRRNKKLLLGDLGRAASEHALDDEAMRRATVRTSGVPTAYRSSQNRSVAHSFRYMRRKPTIVALELPSDADGDGGGGGSSDQHRLSTKRQSLIGKDRRSVSANLASALATVAEDEESTNAASATMAAAAKDGGMMDEKCARHSAAPGGGAGDGGEAGGDERETTPGVDYPVGKALEIYLDGPYGAPSSHIFRAQHAVLIGTGIGVTPFASILQSIMHRYWNARQSCPNCRYVWCSNIPKSIMNLRKVDFFWINRDQRSFEWFVELLSQLEMEQAELGAAMERFLDMHMYITSALQKTDMKALGLQLALELLHEKEKRDLITGLKTRTMAGRPNWSKVFQQIADQNKGKVTVFYCGPPELARVLRVKCHEFGFAFRKESF